MITISNEAWDIMVRHAEKTFPNECCGAMIGTDGNVTVAVPLENAFSGSQNARYEIRHQDIMDSDAEASRLGLTLIGIYHSHPDCDAYFSATDLQNSWPWYSFVVLSIKDGKFDHAACFRPDLDRTSAEKVELIHPWQKS